MESIKNIYGVSRILFFTTGIFIFFAAFALRNNMFMPWSKMALFILDLPFIFFALSFMMSSLFMREERNSVLEGFAIFGSLLFFAGVLFFHFAFRDLV